MGDEQRPQVPFGFLEPQALGIGQQVMQGEQFARMVRRGGDGRGLDGVQTGDEFNQSLGVQLSLRHAGCSRGESGLQRERGVECLLCRGQRVVLVGQLRLQLVQVRQGPLGQVHLRETLGRGSREALDPLVEFGQPFQHSDELRCLIARGGQLPLEVAELLELCRGRGRQAGFLFDADPQLADVGQARSAGARARRWASSAESRSCVWWAAPRAATS